MNDYRRVTAKRNELVDEDSFTAIAEIVIALEDRIEALEAENDALRDEIKNMEA